MGVKAKLFGLYRLQSGGAIARGKFGIEDILLK